MLMIKRNEGKFEKMERQELDKELKWLKESMMEGSKAKTDKRPREENEQHANDPKRKNVQKNGPPTHGTNPPIATQ